MTTAPCANCDQPATTVRPCNHEAAMLHDMLTGAGVYIDPGHGYVLPACAEHVAG